jgi:hypothetical protein
LVQKRGTNEAHKAPEKILRRRKGPEKILRRRKGVNGKGR